MRTFIENKPWISDGFKSIPRYFSDSVEYNVWPKDRKGKNIQSGVYLYGDSPFKPKENSKWNESSYYKISNDTLYLQAIPSDKVHMRTIKIMNDTTIGIHDYYRLQLTAWNTDEKPFKKGLTFNLISKK